MVRHARSKNVELSVDVGISSSSFATVTFKAVFDCDGHEFPTQIPALPGDRTDVIVRRACLEFRSDVVRLTECLETPLHVQETRESNDKTATVSLEGISGLAERVATATFGTVTGLSPRSENRLRNQLVDAGNQSQALFNRRVFLVEVPSDGGSIEAITKAACGKLSAQLNALVECVDRLSGEPN